MMILDTNHISILERRGLEADRLIVRLANVPASEIHVTVISYEEQIRGTLVNDATLLTQNERDFRGIAGLKWEDWTR